MSLRKSILGSVVCLAKILLVKIYLQRQTKSANKYFVVFLRGRLIGGCWECWCWNAKLRWDDGALATGDVGGPDSSSSSPSLLLQQLLNQHYFNVVSQRSLGVGFQQSFNVGWQIYFAVMTSNVSWRAGTKTVSHWQFREFFFLFVSASNAVLSTFCLLHKHRKNCECCPGHYLIVNHYSSMSWFKFRNLSVIVSCVTKSLIH